MSRSRKKPIIKIYGPSRYTYHRQLRSHNKQKLRELLKGDVDNIPLSIEDKSVINDWDYTDYISNCTKKDNCYCMRTFGRKKCTEK